MKTLNFWTLIVSVVKLIILIVKNHFDKNIEKKRKREDAIKQITEAITERDASKITNAFDKLNRL